MPSSRAVGQECEFREIQYSEFSVNGVIALLPQYYLNPPRADKRETLLTMARGRRRGAEQIYKDENDKLTLRSMVE